MPNLPAHIEQWVSTDDWVCPNCGPTGATYHENCTHCGHPLLPDEVKPKLRAILEAAWGVLWEWDWDVSVGDDLSAAMEKLKEAMSNEA